MVVGGDEVERERDRCGRDKLEGRPGVWLKEGGGRQTDGDNQPCVEDWRRGRR